MLKIVRFSRSFGFGGFLCGGLAGLLFYLYPNSFPAQSTLEGVMLLGASFGAAGHRLMTALIIKPLLYYASLLQLRLLQGFIDEKTQNAITRALTIEYFLGETHPFDVLFSDRER